MGIALELDGELRLGLIGCFLFFCGGIWQIFCGFLLFFWQNLGGFLEGFSATYLASF